MRSSFLINKLTFKTHRMAALGMMCFFFISLTPQNASADESDAFYEQAIIAFQNNETSTAIIHLKNALQENQEHMPSRILLAQALIKQGSGSAAEVELNRASQQNVDPRRLAPLFAQAYILQSKYEEVIKLTKSPIHQNGLDSEMLVYKGQALIGKKLFKSADVAFADALTMSPSSQPALLGRAQLALKDGDIVKALAFVEQCVSLPTPYVNGWILKANILQKSGEPTQALAAIEQAFNIDDSHLAARFTRAMILLQQKNYEKAQIDVDFIIEKIPNEPRAGYLKAIINANIANNNNESTEEAELKLAEVISTLSAVPDEMMKITPDYYYLAGLTNFQFGNLNEAKRNLLSYLKYVELHLESIRMIAIIDLRQGNLTAAQNLLTKTNIAVPNNPNILTLLGMVYLRLEENERAEAFFNQVLNMYPDSEVGISNLAQTKMQSGEYQTAIESLLAIKDNDINGDSVKSLLIDSYTQTNQLDKAIVIARALVEKYPESSYYHQNLGVLYGKNKSLENAKTYLEKAVALDNNNIIAIVHLARMKSINNDLDGAKAYLNQQLTIHQDNPLLIAELADAFYLNNELDTALQWIKKAYSVDPNNFYVVSRIATLMSENDNAAEAIDIVDSFIGQNKKELRALVLIASLYQKENKHHQAVLALREYVNQSYRKATAYQQLAKAQILANDQLGALQSYKKATIADPKSLSAHIGLVNLVIKNKDETYAKLLIDTISALTKSESLKQTLLGDLYLALNKADKAIEHYKIALKHGEQRQALLGLYRASSIKKEYADVIVVLTQWIETHPNDLLAKVSLADGYRNNGDLEKSANYYEQLIADHGDIPLLLNNAANVNFAYGQHEKALEYARLAYQYQPKSVAIIDTLAWIESKLNNHKKALGLLRNALTIDYDNAEVKYHLAVTLAALNRKSEAKKYLTEAVNSHQDYEEKSAAIALLKTWS